MKLEKRSLRIAGHRTSVALEPLFWVALERLAHARGVSIPTLCAIVDQTRIKTEQSLASALRCTVLQYAMDAQKARVAA